MCNGSFHKLAIHDLLTRFFQAFDDKNWGMMRDCLCDEVFVSDGSFRKLPPTRGTGDRYVAERRASLEGLEMQHNFSNLRVEVDATADTAVARCNYSIHRFRRSFGGMAPQYFHCFGHYVLAFVSIGGAWRISSITQHRLRNHGIPEGQEVVRLETEVH
jgi:hypothetical protein